MDNRVADGHRNAGAGAPNHTPTGDIRSVGDSPRPAGLDRREFLQCTAGGALLSVLAGRTTAVGPDGDVTLAAAGFRMVLHFPKDGGVVLRSLKNTATDFEWCQPNAPIEPAFTVAKQVYSGWTARPGSDKPGRFAFTTRHASGVTGEYALRAVANAPVVEIRAGFQNTSGRPIDGVSAVGAVRLRLRDDIGRVQLHTASDGSFPTVLEAEGKHEYLLVGQEWSAGGQAVLEERPDGKWLTLAVTGAASLPGVSPPPFTYDMAPGEHLQAPWAFLGVAHGDVTNAFRTAQRYLKQHVFPEPLEHWPWVHYNYYNFWSSGVQAQEIFLREIDFAAGLGVELITHDASWYTGSAKDGNDNWGLGLGNYTDDREKYPMGLAAISGHVHQKGMKFGLWVGPNIVDPRLVGTVVKEDWLCKVDGKRQVQDVWGPEHAPVMACFGCPGYVEYLKTELTGVIERFHVDVLRWDDSGMTGSCNRTDHGHQAGDWGYAWLKGQQDVFNYLHAKFPNLVIERCFGAEYAEARTVRAARGDIGGGLPSGDQAYPSSYIGSWLVSEQTPKDGGKDVGTVDTVYRSLMAAWFGFGLDQGQASLVSKYPQPMLDAARRNIRLYKQFRHLLYEGDYYALAPSATAGQAPWRAGAFVAPSGNEAVVLAFRGSSPQQAVRVPLQGLREQASYELTSANTGNRSVVRGGELMRDGLPLSLAQADTSEVVLIRSRAG